MAERLAAIPEVLGVHTITGVGDTLCRPVARTNADLQRVRGAIVSAEGAVRSATLVSLATQLRCRILPLVRDAASDGAPRPHDGLHQIQLRPGAPSIGYPEIAALFMEAKWVC